MKEFTIALAGNPNSGKTTLFNLLTGARQHVGNYPGITVEKREGYVKHGEVTLRIVDLPGTYSLTAYSQEELVARNFIVNEKPSLVVDVIDATNLERHMYLAVQFMELGVPLILALNMMDEVKKKGMEIDIDRLSSLLKCPVVPMVAKKGIGKNELIEQVVECSINERDWVPITISYGPDLDPVIEKMSELIRESNFLTEKYPPRWIALKYLEEDEDILCKGDKQDKGVSSGLKALAKEVSKHCEKTLNTVPEAIIADYRYGYINSLLKGVIKRRFDTDRLDISDKIDKVLTHRFIGPLIMVFVLYLMFKMTFLFGEYPLALIEKFFGLLSNVASKYLPPGFFKSLVVSGIIDGVGGVMSFVPLIMIMFFILAFLEDSGYMARMAYMLDRVLRIFGLHGYSVMPFIISGGIPGGCAVPGIMATRTLRGPKEKIATILTAPFFSCGAKVPVFLLLAGAFFPKSGDKIMFALTIFSWLWALVIAKLFRTTVIPGESTPFVMELPPYRLPTLKGLIIHTWERVWQYLRKAGTVILLISIIIWAGMSFPSPPKKLIDPINKKLEILEMEISKTDITQEKKNEILQQIQKLKGEKKKISLINSFAGRLGIMVENVTKIAGFDWRSNIALLGGIAAKEVIVSTLGTAYSLGEVDVDNSSSLSKRIASDPNWNNIKAISFMVFVLIYAPCFVSLVTIAQESNWKWAVFSVTFNTITAFLVSVLIYQVGIRFF
ncbi:ferrous iron transport protein B [Desulfothermus okinawensis JCM 13304]